MKTERKYKRGRLVEEKAINEEQVKKAANSVEELIERYGADGRGWGDITVVTIAIMLLVDEVRKLREGICRRDKP